MQFRRLFIVKRKQTGQYVNGLWAEGLINNIEIMASVQPVSGKEMEMLPEGRRNSQAVKIYTDTELNTVGSGNPDILLAFGSEFEIQTVEPWQSDVINHYKCIGVKLDA